MGILEIILKTPINILYFAGLLLMFFLFLIIALLFFVSWIYRDAISVGFIKLPAIFGRQRVRALLSAILFFIIGTLGVISFFPIEQQNDCSNQILIIQKVANRIIANFDNKKELHYSDSLSKLNK